MAIKKIISYLSLASILMLLLPACKKRAVQQLHLRPLTSYLDYQAHKQGITVRAKQLSLADCQPVLGKSAQNLFKKRRRKHPIYPIQLSISNSTQRMTTLKPEHITLQLTDCKTVANRLQGNSFAQAFGSIAAGLLVTTLLAAGSFFSLSASGIVLLVAGSSKALAPVAIFGGSALLLAPAFLLIGTPVASTMKGIETSKHNVVIRKEIKQHGLKDVLVIDAQETVDTLIFVDKRNYQDRFTITFANPNNAQEKITFTVQLRRP